MPLRNQYSDHGVRGCVFATTSFAGTVVATTVLLGVMLGSPAHAAVAHAQVARSQVVHTGLDSATVATLASSVLVLGSALVAGVRISRRKW